MRREGLMEEGEKGTNPPPAGLMQQASEAWATYNGVFAWIAAITISCALGGVMGGIGNGSDFTRGPPTAYLAANKGNVHWGFYSSTLAPSLTVASGTTVTVEMLTHHAGDYYDGMIAGDAGVESVYDFYSAGIGSGSVTPGRTPVTGMRGATGAGDGVHILTGPIAVEGAVPGDVIAVTIKDLRPRVNPNTGKTYGINAAAWWGYNFGVNGPAPGGMFGKGSAAGMHYDTATPGPAFAQTGFTGGAYQREMTTVYEIVNDATGKPAFAQPAFQFQYGLNGSVTTPCLLDGSGNPVTSVTNSPGVSVACAASAMNWKGYQYPGMVTDHSKTTLDHTVHAKWQVPINFHVGSMGLAPASPAFVDSVPPMPTGGNIDDRRLGIGATLYLPVQVAGGLLSMGDAHTAQGDSELDGTGIETHITGDFMIELIKGGASMPAFLKGLNMPLLENDSEYVIHGFTYTDYLTELGYANTACSGTGVSFLGGTSTYNPTGCPPPGTSIYFESAIEPAMANAHKQARDFLMKMGYDEDAATTMITLAGDFGTTQIVDGNWGVHVNIPKYILQGSQTAPYAQSVTCGGSIVTPAATPAPPAGCPAAGCDYTLAANSSTVNWGFYSSVVPTALTVMSGKTVSVEMLSHHAGDYYSGMIQGDAGIESIYNWGINGAGTPPGLTAAADMRGASGGGDGVHILTGPISVSDATGPALAGDVIKVDILSLKPRLNPAGKSYGINAAAWWGYHYGVNGPLARHWQYSTTVFPSKSQTGYITGDPDREMTNVYQIVMDSNGNPLYAEPAFRFVYGLNTTVPCIAPGSTPTGFSPGATVPCTGGKQTFPMYHYPGVITAHPTGNEDYTVAKKWQIPLNFHIGSLGLAPASPAYINSIPPNPYGGNMDDRRLGVGASIYLKVQTTGGLLSMGDAHGAQGDSELDGTGIEMHVNGQFRITLIRQGTGSATVPAAVLGALNFPLIENANEFVVHSFTDPDWVTAKNLSVTACNGTMYATLGGTTTYNPMGCQNDAYLRALTPCGAQGEVFCTSSTDDAVANTYHAARKFVSAMTGLSESNAISLLTVGCDLGITQVVDGNYGAHYVIPKYMLSGTQTTAYKPATLCKTSMPTA